MFTLEKIKGEVLYNLRIKTKNVKIINKKTNFKKKLYICNENNMARYRKHIKPKGNRVSDEAPIQKENSESQTKK